MIAVTVVRSQHAVGHGGFHPGRIKVLHTMAKGLEVYHLSKDDSQLSPILDFRYVYDCGSEHSAALSFSIGRLRGLRHNGRPLRVAHSCRSRARLDHCRAIPRSTWSGARCPR
jgi:hypothetical protein